MLLHANTCLDREGKFPVPAPFNDRTGKSGTKSWRERSVLEGCFDRTEYGYLMGLLSGGDNPERAFRELFDFDARVYRENASDRVGTRSFNLIAYAEFGRCHRHTAP